MNTPSSSPKTSIVNLFLSAVFGIIGGLLTIGMVAILDQLTTLVWSNGAGYNLDDPSRGWAQLIILLVVGLTIGVLAKRYGPSTGNIESVISESLENGKIDWRAAFKNVGIGILSIGSGASLGPEAPAAMLTGGVASFAADKAKLGIEVDRVLNISAISGMLGSLLSSPFVATAMFIEFAKGKLSELHATISYTFVAGSFGIATFYVLFHKLYASSFGIPTLSGGPTIDNLLMAFVFGLVGAIFTVIVGLIMRAAEPVFARLDQRLVVRSLIGAAVAGVLAVIFPLTMFSGQHSIGTLIAQAASTSAIILLLLAFVKLIATTTLIRTGFFGGPIFPAIFAGTALGLALNTFVHVPEAVAISAAIAGIMTISLRRPLSAALITIAIAGTSDAPLIAVAVSGALIIVTLIEQRQPSASE